MTRTLLALLVVGAVGLAPSRAYAQQKALKVFILAGQSNMVGKRAQASGLPAELQAEQKRAVFFDGRKWRPVAPGATEPEGFGPEISFAYRMASQWNEPVGIIKHSVGGTNLAVQWSPNLANFLYAQLLQKVRAARRSRSIELVGMLWMQGESDARDQRMALSYAGNLQTLIRRVRRDTNSPRLLFVAGRVNPPKQGFPFVETVRVAQERCKESNYAFIDCDVLEKGPDNLHYTTMGLVNMGYAFADAVEKLRPQKRGSPPKP